MIGFLSSHNTKLSVLSTVYRVILTFGRCSRDMGISVAVNY